MLKLIYFLSSFLLSSSKSVEISKDISTDTICMWAWLKLKAWKIAVWTRTHIRAPLNFGNNPKILDTGSTHNLQTSDFQFPDKVKKKLSLLSFLRYFIPTIERWQLDELHLKAVYFQWMYPNHPDYLTSTAGSIVWPVVER